MRNRFCNVAGMTRPLGFVLVGFTVLVLPRATAQAQGKRAPRSLDAHVLTPLIMHATLAFAESFEPQSVPLARGTMPRPPGLAGGVPSQTVAPVPTTCTPHWREGDHGTLDRCIDGDGAGCAGVADVYESGCDAYSSIKWYRRGCRLGSSDACVALTRLGEVVPPP
jgi:hypothetical protein